MVRRTTLMEHLQYGGENGKFQKVVLLSINRTVSEQKKLSYKIKGAAKGAPVTQIKRMNKIN